MSKKKIPQGDEREKAPDDLLPVRVSDDVQSISRPRYPDVEHPLRRYGNHGAVANPGYPAGF